MDELNRDSAIKNIMADSRLEVANPDFERILMDKIVARHRKQSIIHTILHYFLIFISIDAVILTFLKLFHIKIAEMMTSLSSSLHEVQNSSFKEQLFYVYFLTVGTLVFAIYSASAKKKSKRIDSRI